MMDVPQPPKRRHKSKKKSKRKLASQPIVATPNPSDINRTMAAVLTANSLKTQPPPPTVQLAMRLASGGAPKSFDESGSHVDSQNFELR
mmetsp:Transcript_29208/g.68806  ORF Transcript_29208/g.68806 Transcript_29208/m.68806 type:complete len:89 (+) Transcript_29208:67-333(+)